MYMQEGSAVQYDTLHEELDIAAIGDGCISVTPLAFERTNLAVFEKLK
jgi:broad specificity polyphosphatase/5'/3'-nucleotidase SurE